VTDVAPVRTAVVGLGYWGPNLVRNLHEIGEASMDLVCDSRPDSLEPLLTRYPALRGTTSFEEVLADDSIEAVAIVTPVATHAPLARAALDAGKHVFVEKPMTSSSADAEDLMGIAERRGLTLMPGHTFLYSPPVNLIKDIISSGELGEIYFITSSRVNLGIHQSDVSVVWDLAPHDFSILRYWLEDTPDRVSATTRSCVIPGVADVAFIDLQYPQGTIVHVELSWLAPSKLRRTAIVGSDKMIVYDDTSNEPVRVFDSGVTMRNPQTFGEYRLSYRTGDIVSPRIDPIEPLSLELKDFCRAVRGGPAPRSSAQLGYDVVRMIEDVEQSMVAFGSRAERRP
jgi:predicted dehydrogenase